MEKEITQEPEAELEPAPEAEASAEPAPEAEASAEPAPEAEASAEPAPEAEVEAPKPVAEADAPDGDSADDGSSGEERGGDFRDRAPRGRADADERDERPRRRGGRGRRRVCIMCADKMTHIDYKDIEILRRFISDRGRIESRRKGGACAKHQRAIAQAIKRARYLALLPYTAEHMRTGVGHHR
jgi:small subunit ribosomal protein S18